MIYGCLTLIKALFLFSSCDVSFEISTHSCFFVLFSLALQDRLDSFGLNPLPEYFELFLIFAVITDYSL